MLLLLLLPAVAVAAELAKVGTAPAAVESPAAAVELHSAVANLLVTAEIADAVEQNSDNDAAVEPHSDVANLLAAAAAAVEPPAVEPVAPRRSP